MVTYPSHNTSSLSVLDLSIASDKNVKVVKNYKNDKTSKINGAGLSIRIS